VLQRWDYENDSWRDFMRDVKLVTNSFGCKPGAYCAPGAVPLPVPVSLVISMVMTLYHSCLNVLAASADKKRAGYYPPFRLEIETRW
jgi:hypothetical protein